MKTLTLFGWVYIALVLVMGPVNAKPGKGGGGSDSKPAMQSPAQNEPSGPVASPAETKAVPPAKEPLVNVKLGLSQEERKMIQGSMAQPSPSQPRTKNGKALPKGLAKKGKPLPPGWQKNCGPGQIMPAAVFEAAQPLPAPVVAKLPPPPAGTITVTVEGKVVRLLQATHEILDVFDVHVGL